MGRQSCSSSRDIVLTRLNSLSVLYLDEFAVGGITRLMEIFDPYRLTLLHSPDPD